MSEKVNVLRTELESCLMRAGMLAAELSRECDKEEHAGEDETGWFPAGWYDNITEGMHSDEHAGAELVNSHGWGRFIMNGVRKYLADHLGFSPD